MRQNETVAQIGLRRQIATIAGGVAGVSTLALLAAGSLAPLFADGMTTASIATWLSSLGSHTLAIWLEQWARSLPPQAMGQHQDAEWSFVNQLARDIQGQTTVNAPLAADVGMLLAHVHAIPTALDALAGHDEQQIRLLRLLLTDLQSATFHNERLDELIRHEHVVQGEALHSVIERRDRTLLAEIR